MSIFCVYSYIFLLKTEQNISNLVNLGDFFSFYINSLSQVSAYFTTFSQSFENKRSGNKISDQLFKCVKQNVVIINHKKYLRDHRTFTRDIFNNRIHPFKMHGLYLYTLIIGHKSGDILSILNKLNL